jgi:histidinol-phosphatase
MDQFLAVARQAAEAARRVTLARFGKDMSIELKQDQSPVTEADTLAEQAIIATIRASFPDHAFLGEESGSSGHGDFVWVIDPIDGTKNFIDGIPLWGTLIALVQGDEVVLGLSDMPVLGDTVWAQKSRGAFRNGSRVHVSNRRGIDDAMVSFGSIGPFRQQRREAGLLQLLHGCRRHRCFGDCWPFHLLASGNLEVVVEAAIKPVDVACFDIIIREAGGRFSDLDGKPFSFDISHVAATNGLVHDEVLAYLEPGEREE